MTRPDGRPLLVRCGVNTGEALVRLDVTPGSGEGFLTGDAVNTAARLQAAAPPMGVAVGALTHQLTERVIVFEEAAAGGRQRQDRAGRGMAGVDSGRPHRCRCAAPAAHASGRSCQRNV